MPRTFRHWTPRYIVNRVALAWYERRSPSAPWLTKGACRYLEDWLKPSYCGLEWGSGRSTLWFAERVAQLTSVEHSPAWFAQVKVQLQSRGLSNVDYHLAQSEMAASGPCPAYVRHGSELQPGSLDFMLVDGQYRDLCAQAALKIVRPGGILIIDNVERYLPHASHSPVAIGQHGAPPSPAWRSIAKALDQWECIWTSNGVFDTAIFMKPAAAARLAA